MTKEEITTKVTDEIVKLFGVARENVTPDARIIEDLGADSLDAVELLMNLETMFNICIPEADADSKRTVADIVDYIDSRLKGKEQ